MATPDEFFAIDMRVGTVVHAEPFPEARKPSIKLVIDFGGDIGQKQSSAQLTVHYTPTRLVGRQVVAAVNLGSRRLAGSARGVERSRSMLDDRFGRFAVSAFRLSFLVPTSVRASCDRT